MRPPHYLDHLSSVPAVVLLSKFYCNRTVNTHIHLFTYNTYSIDNFVMWGVSLKTGPDKSAANGPRPTVNDTLISRLQENRNTG